MDIQCKLEELADILQYIHTHYHTSAHIEAFLNSQTTKKRNVGTESVL